MEFIPVERPAGDFQQSLTLPQLEQLCTRAFGSKTVITSIREISSGKFNNTYLIKMNGHQPVILRVSPHPSAEVFANEVNLLRREYALQPYFATIAPLLPHNITVDFSRQILDRDYVFQSFIEGEVWDEVQEQLSETENNALWHQLGEIAQQIHSVSGPAFGFPYPQQQFPRWSDAVLNIAESMRDNLISLNLDTSGTEPYLEAVSAGREFLDEFVTPYLIHGDLWPKNVLIDRVNGTPQIVGLLDSERGFWGDPMAEWIYYYLEIPDAYWNGHGKPEEDTAARFRYSAYHGTYAIQLLLESHRFDWNAEDFRQHLVDNTRQMNSLLGSRE